MLHRRGRDLADDVGHAGHGLRDVGHGAAGVPGQRRALAHVVVAHLAHVWTASQDIARIAQPMMRRDWEVSGETVALFVPQGADRVCIAEIVSTQALSFKRGVGYKERLALGASGRAILAFRDQDPADIEGLLAGLDKNLDSYRRELELTRQRRVCRQRWARGGIETIRSSTWRTACHAKRGSRSTRSVRSADRSLTPNRLQHHDIRLGTEGDIGPGIHVAIGWNVQLTRAERTFYTGPMRDDHVT